MDTQRPSSTSGIQMFSGKRNRTEEVAEEIYISVLVRDGKAWGKNAKIGKVWNMFFYNDK